MKKEGGNETVFYSVCNLTLEKEAKEDGNYIP
jgi:hypothetical protein